MAAYDDAPSRELRGAVSNAGCLEYGLPMIIL
jgi:hypothetical protein